MQKKADYFEIPQDFLENALAKCIDDVKAKSFEDIVNMQGSLNREVYLGDIEDGTGSSIEGYIRFWNDYDEDHNIPVEDRIPIKIYINSYGGNLIDTFEVIDAIEMSKTPVWTINSSAAYSGGFFIFICGHRRFAYPHSSFLYHEGATSNGGTANQFANYAAFYKRELNQLKKIVLENTEISEEKYKEIQKDDFWMDAEDAIFYGVADEILSRFVINEGKGKKVPTTYTCDKEHCCNSCPGHFDSANDPVCQRPDGEYTVGESGNEV